MASILVVDDDPSVRAALRLTLQCDGHSVTALAEAWDALARFTAAGERFDLVVTDVWMPGMDGLQLIRAVRARAPDVPIIAISGRGSRQGGASTYLNAALAAGATHTVQKPVAPPDLCALVRDTLARQR